MSAAVSAKQARGGQRSAERGSGGGTAQPGRTPGAGRVALAMAPGEARRIARSVPFLIFVFLTLLTLVTAGRARLTWPIASIEVAVGMVPLGWCLLVLTDLATLRDKRKGVAVLTDTMPASETARTGGHLLGGLVGVPVAAALLALCFVLPPERFGSPNFGEMLVPLLLVAGGAVLGVATARLLPWALMTVPVIFATIFITGKIGEARINRSRFLGFIANPTPTELPMLEVRPTALHVVWLAAWTAMMAMVALLRYDRRPRFIGATVAIGVVIVVAGVGQVRAIDADTAAARADVLNDASAHQECVKEGTVTYCTYPEVGHRVDDWKTTTSAVLARVPAEVAERPLTLAQRVPYYVGNSNCGRTPLVKHVDEPIAREIDVSQAWAADGDVHPSVYADNLPCSEETLNGLFTAIGVGAWAVGLPPAQWGRSETCVADGQARAAVALWLAAASGGHLDTFLENVNIDGAGRIDLTDWNTQPPVGVTWHEGDLGAALAMADLPDDQVEAVVVEHWDELVDPATSTSRLLALLELPAGEPLTGGGDDCPSPAP